MLERMAEQAGIVNAHVGGDPAPLARTCVVADLVRAARRHADLSQRQLAEASKVSTATIERIEASLGARPLFETVTRLLDAAGTRLVLVDDDGGLIESRRQPATDRAGRVFPAHLDVRESGPFGGWWGDWPYLSCLAEKFWHLSPRQRPDHTFDLNRLTRDDRRRDHGYYP